MSDCVTQGTTVDCAAGTTPGLDKVWGLDRDDIVDFDIDALQDISALTLAVAKVFIPLEFEEGTAFFEEEGVISKKKVVGYENTLKIFVPGNTSANRLTIEQFKRCSCGVVMLFLDKDGEYRIIGLGDIQDHKVPLPLPATLLAADEPSRVYMKEQKGVTGDALDSDKQEEIAYGATQKVKARYYTGSLAGLF